MEKEFRAKEICELSGATKSQLSPWVAAGAIVPIKDDPRRGGVRIYSRQNLAVAMICKELANYSLPVREIATTVRLFENYNDNNIDSNVWLWLEKDPDMFLGVSRLGSFDYDNWRKKDHIKGVYMDGFLVNATQNRINADYLTTVLKEEALANFIKSVSSVIIIDLKSILEKAGMIEK